ncbi:hypothetical protein C5167_012412 [Papaver somniferum]|uniref:Uncharacterized protein n=1 Tax=Papaver somniferum TaxID=3469 RepID=A0A4Y7IXD8_PAPSO|nr:hypothetical protein C5167_012412 [Papaver somniferum]
MSVCGVRNKRNVEVDGWLLQSLHIWKLRWESARVNEKATKLCQGVAAVNKFEDEAYNRVG